MNAEKKTASIKIDDNNWPRVLKGLIRHVELKSKQAKCELEQAKFENQRLAQRVEQLSKWKWDESDRYSNELLAGRTAIIKNAKLLAKIKRLEAIGNRLIEAVPPGLWRDAAVKLWTETKETPP